MRPVSRRPAHITPPPKSAAAAAAPSGTSAADLGLEAEIFWDRHRIKVIGSLVLAVVGILGYSMFLYFRASALASANAELSAAKSIDEIKKVIADHSNSIVAADAYLVLAQKQSEARDFDAAAASAQALTEKFPDYPMRGAALLAVGANLEAGGKLGQADAAYKSATETVPADFAAPIALLARANLAKLRGNDAEARRFLDDVMTRFPGSTAAAQAEQDKRFVRVATNASPVVVPALVVPAASPAKTVEAPVSK